MDLAWVSLAALVAVILLSCATAVNVGLLAIALAWAIGVYGSPDDGAPLDVKVKAVAAGFPSVLFLTLVGVSLLFSLADANGTLPRVAQQAVRCCRGSARVVPLMFFGLTTALSAVGPGSIAAAALVAPTAMAVARQVGVSPLVMIIMVGHGSIAGGLSPFTILGIIADERLGKMGLSGHEWEIFLQNLLANAAVALGAYVLLGGWRRKSTTSVQENPQAAASEGWALRHWVTLTVIAALLAGVVFAKVDVGFGAFAAAGLLIVLRLADEREAMRKVPWGVIVMVCGMTVLVAVAEKAGGMKLFTSLLAAFATAETIPGFIAAVTGVVSVFSSTSGVVLPTFLPMVRDLAEKLGGADMLAIASSIVVGGNLVDVSPASTVGALCLAAAGVDENRRRLFNQLLVWGLSMSLVGAAICQVFFGWLR
jgi:di/tricarboxylate transporter